MVNQKAIIGAIITGVVVTVLVNDAGLNLTGVLKTLGTIADLKLSWF